MSQTWILSPPPPPGLAWFRSGEASGEFLPSYDQERSQTKEVSIQCFYLPWPFPFPFV